ncbi:MAG: Tol-Pal system beta propeller repeat protein TolB [Gammaproteobacteria bacterium]
MTDRATWTLARTIAIAVAALAAASAHAQLKIEITSGVTDPIPVAIVPFARAIPADGGLDVAAIVQQDLEGSGRFRAMPRSTMRVMPVRGNDVVIDDWRADGNDYALVGRVSPLDGTQLAVDFELINLLNGQRLASQRFTGTQSALRNAAHRVSDVVYEKIVGVRGAFATRIAYVSVDGAPPARRWQLIVADADGENARPITESRRPIMSPAWSPDGQWLAYVSFENRASGVFVQRAKTGERRQVSARAGINGAPVWSPDGKRLAITLGGSAGNLDIYVVDLTNESQNLTRLTDDAAIDTEPAWAPDGKTLYFTSDRAGGPQIYRLTVGSNERPRRVTFGSGYNTRPRISPDGRELAMVTLDGSAYRVAVQDLASGTVRVLSRGRLDESPSYAPNGALLIFSGRDAGRTVLATVSVDGLTSQRLKSDQGDVREPVWGPFLP